MGLLKKATKNSASPSSPLEYSIDEMGKALCSRLLSLQADSIRPETAISLLKAYGSFQTGICLSLRKGSYSAYASVGTGSAAKLVFPQEKLKPVPGKKYYSVQHKLSSPSLQLWAFPLTSVDKGYPLAILAVEAEKSFQREAVEAVLRQTRAVFLPPPEFTGNTFAGSFSNEEDPKAKGLLNRISRKKILEKTVMESLSSEKGAFQGLIIEALQYSAGGFSGRIFSMVSAFGTAQPLTPGRCLVLFGPAQDGDLIARHLEKTVSGKKIFRFRAENPQEALALLKPYF